MVKTFGAEVYHYTIDVFDRRKVDETAKKVTLLQNNIYVLLRISHLLLIIT